MDEAGRPLSAADAALARREALHALSPASVAAYLGGDMPREIRIALSGPRPEKSFGLASFPLCPARALAVAALSWVESPSTAVRYVLADAVGLRALALDLGEPAYAESLLSLPEERRGSVAALGERLKEYEADRARFPALRDFYPRLEPLLRARAAEAERGAGIRIVFTSAAGGRLSAADAEFARREALRALSPASVAAYLGGELPREIRVPLPDPRPARALAVAALSWITAPSEAVRSVLADAVGLRALALDLGEPAYAAGLLSIPAERRAAVAALGDKLKEYESAREQYPALRDFYPRLSPLAGVRLDAAERAAKAGNRAAALAELAAAGETPSGEESERRAAALYERLGEAGRARALLEALVAAAPGEARRRVDLAAFLVRAGDPAAARAALDVAAKAAPSAAERRRMALLRQELKDYAGAVELLQALAAERPDDAGVRADLGLSLFLAGKPDAAVAALKAAIRLDRAGLAAYLTLGSIYAGQGRFAEEKALYDSVPASGGDPALRALLVESLRRSPH